MQEEANLGARRIYLRADQRVGLLAFSGISGLIYAIPSSLAHSVQQWVESGQHEHIPDEVKYSLGAGWAVPLENARFSSPHLLPNSNAWQIVPEPQWPILVNWFITGRCPLDCRYCYAMDLMRDDSTEPRDAELERSAEAILALRPVVVVLTGGDPLFGPNFFRAVPLLGNHVGLSVDTSGYSLNERHIEIIKEYGIAVRISLDSEIPKVQGYQRSVYNAYPELSRKLGGSLEAAVRAVERCLANNIPVTIQTVATVENANELVSLGEKLRRWGVHSWRVLKVSPSEARLDNYKQLVGLVRKDGRPVKGHAAEGPFEYVFRELARKYGQGRIPNFALQITENNTRNAVILVGPDGTFWTESNVGIKKIVIDEEYPKQPRLHLIHSRINMNAHAERYLNMTTSTFISSKQEAEL